MVIDIYTCYGTAIVQIIDKRSNKFKEQYKNTTYFLQET